MSKSARSWLASLIFLTMVVGLIFFLTFLGDTRQKQGSHHLDNRDVGRLHINGDLDLRRERSR